MAYLLHQKSGKTILLDEQAAITIIGLDLFKEAEIAGVKGVKGNHALIEFDRGTYRIGKKDGNTIVNGVPLSAPLTLEHNSAILFGDKKKGAIFIFKDPAQEKRLFDTQRLAKIKTYDFATLKNSAEQMSRKFFREAPNTLTAYCGYLLKFLKENFRIQRGVVYHVVEKPIGGWVCKPLQAIAATKTLVDPPRTIMDKVWETREPQRFSLTEAGGSEELSRSIVENNVYSAICFPLMAGGNKDKSKNRLLGVLYMDTLEEAVQLSEDDLLVLCTIMPGISALFKTLLEHQCDRLEAYRVVSSFTEPNNILWADSCLVNKDLNSISTVRAGSQGIAFLIFIHIAQLNPNIVDIVLQVSAYSGILALIDASKLDPEFGDGLIGDIHNFIGQKFPSLRVSVGIAIVEHNGEARFHGVGDLSIAVKPPQRKSFYNEVNTRLLGSTTYEAPVYEKYEVEMGFGSMIAMSTIPATQLCRLLDRATTLEDVEPIFKNLKMGIVTYVKEI